MSKIDIKTLVSLVGTKLKHSQELNLELINVEHGKVSLRMPYDPKIVGDIRTGLLHGGAITALMDTCLGCVAISHNEENILLSPTLDLRMDYIQPAESKDVIAEGELIRAGKNLAFTRAIAHQGDRNNPIALCSGNFMQMETNAPDTVVQKITGVMTDPAFQLNKDTTQQALNSFDNTEDCMAALKQCRESGDISQLLACIPYANTLGINRISMGDEKVYCMAYKESLMGNPLLPALHGGAISGFMELSAALHVMVEGEVERVPKIIDFSIDFLRAGKLEETYALCQVVRQGRKIVNVAVTAWQANREMPIATARCHFLL